MFIGISNARVRFWTSALLLSLGTACSGPGRSNETTDPVAPIEIASKPGEWRPDTGGTQVALWPEDLALREPDTGNHPEEVGHGSEPVAGKPWQWASYVTRPTMTIYRPKGEDAGTTLLVLPGGGYAAVAMDLEGTEICDWATGKGMTCVILKYRVPQDWPRNEEGVREPPEVLLALQDVQRAIGLLRARFGIAPSKIGVIGFSAGAHLAAAVSNAETRTYPKVDDADDLSSRPDFAIMMYTGRLWYTANAPTDLSLAPWVSISKKAPPTLLIHAMDDPVNDVRHPMAYALALEKAGVPVDLRIYSGGGHAFGLRPTSDPITTQWPAQVEQWLRNISAL
ncbi:MAG: alpha/beta hydrolase [Porphyrobacter sp.]|nr:alpha/beta hydrolase [Porphyrobacter sp.]